MVVHQIYTNIDKLYSLNSWASLWTLNIFFSFFFLIIMYTTKQRDALETFYSNWNDLWLPHEKRNQIRILSDNIGLTNDQIRAWIRNRRARGGYKGKVHHTPKQVQMLEAIYIHHSKYPSRLFKSALAKEIGLTPAQVKIWFQCRRQRKAPRLLSKAHTENQETLNYKDLIERVNISVREHENSVSQSDKMVQSDLGRSQDPHVNEVYRNYLFEQLQREQQIEHFRQRQWQQYHNQCLMQQLLERQRRELQLLLWLPRK